MGGAISKNIETNEKEDEISEKIDYIATYYILTSNFKSLKELYKKEYCDDLVILTSDIIQKHLNYQQISYLQSRIVNGDDTNAIKEEPAIFFSHNALQKDVKKSITNEKNKSRMCIGIAKFYIKIAHIFAAIITSVNPLYSYMEDGEEKQVGGSEKNEIPDGVHVRIKKGSLCQRRLEALSSGYEYINASDKTEAEIRVGANLCDFKSKDSLFEEPGIPELEELYYDKYDFEEGKFYAMTDKSRQMYENDVKGFYEIFMNTSDVPETIRKFSDIKLKDFKTMSECQGDAPLFKRTFKDSPKNSLFFEYSENIKRMIKNTEENQDALLDIINEIFVYTIDPDTGDKLVRIDPLLTMSKLEEIIINTRSLLIKLYLTCETDFNEGVRVFKSIADTMTVYKLRDEIDELEKSESIQEYLKMSNDRYKNALSENKNFETMKYSEYEPRPESMRDNLEGDNLESYPNMESSMEPNVESELNREPIEPESREPDLENMKLRDELQTETPLENMESMNETEESGIETKEHTESMEPIEMNESKVDAPHTELSTEQMEGENSGLEPEELMNPQTMEQNDVNLNTELSNPESQERDVKITTQPSSEYPFVNLNSKVNEPKNNLETEDSESNSIYDAPFNEAKGTDEISELRKEIERLKLNHQELLKLVPQARVEQATQVPQSTQVAPQATQVPQSTQVAPQTTPPAAQINEKIEPLDKENRIESQAQEVPLMGGIKLNKLINKYVR